MGDLPPDLPAVPHLATLAEYLSKSDLDPGSSDFSTLSMDITFGGLVKKIQILVITNSIEKGTERNLGVDGGWSLKFYQGRNLNIT